MLALQSSSKFCGICHITSRSQVGQAARHVHLMTCTALHGSSTSMHGLVPFIHLTLQRTGMDASHSSTMIVARFCACAAQISCIVQRLLHHCIEGRLGILLHVWGLLVAALCHSAP